MGAATAWSLARRGTDVLLTVDNGIASVEGVAVAKELGMAPFMVDKARRMMRGWDGERLGAAVTALARCDHEVKGAARDPHSAVERVVDEICRLHG